MSLGVTHPQHDPHPSQIDPLQAVDLASTDGAGEAVEGDRDRASVTELCVETRRERGVDGLVEADSAAQRAR